MNKMEYNTMKRLSMFSLHKNAQSLLNAGISDAKANMIVVFATYILHQPKKQIPSRHHHSKQIICIPKNLTFDDIMDFNLRLLHPQQLPQQMAHPKRMPQQMAHPQRMPQQMTHPRQPPPPLKPIVSHSHTVPTIPTTCDKTCDVNDLAKSNSSLSLQSCGSRRSQRSHKSHQSQAKKSVNSRRSNRRLVNRQQQVTAKKEVQPEKLDCIDESFQSAKSHGSKNTLHTSRSFESATTAKTSMSMSSRWGSEELMVPSPNLTFPAVVVEESNDEEEQMVPPPPALRPAASAGTVGTLQSASPCQRPSRRPSLGAGDDAWRSSCCSQKCDSIPSRPPRCPASRASMKWALALDDAYGVDEDLTDSEFDDDSDNGDDSESDYDSDDSDSDSDDDSSDDEEFEEEETPKFNKLARKNKALAHNGGGNVLHWKTQNVVTHEWTLPANQVLPVRLQSLFHEAAQNPKVDIQQRLQEALMGMGGPQGK